MKRQPTEWEKILQTISPIGINLQNIVAAHAAQYQKNEQPKSKSGQKTKTDISPKKTYK